MDVKNMPVIHGKTSLFVEMTVLNSVAPDEAGAFNGAGTASSPSVGKFEALMRAVVPVAGRGLEKGGTRGRTSPAPHFREQDKIWRKKRVPPPIWIPPSFF